MVEEERLEGNGHVPGGRSTGDSPFSLDRLKVFGLVVTSSEGVTPSPSLHLYLALVSPCVVPPSVCTGGHVTPLGIAPALQKTQALVEQEAPAQSPC